MGSRHGIFPESHYMKVYTDYTEQWTACIKCIVMCVCQGGFTYNVYLDLFAWPCFVY